jgi:hypothetical protein
VQQIQSQREARQQAQQQVREAQQAQEDAARRQAALQILLNNRPHALCSRINCLCLLCRCRDPASIQTAIRWAIHGIAQPDRLTRTLYVLSMI